MTEPSGGEDVWRPIERMQELVWRLVDEGIVDEQDDDKCLASIVWQMERWGQVPRHSGQRVTNRSRLTKEQQLQAVNTYIKFARHARSSYERHAKILALGVTPAEMTRWSRKYYGRGTLAATRPRSALRHILEQLAKRPWQARHEVVFNTGIPASSLPGALHWGMRTGRLKRRMGEKGLYEYAIA